MKTRVLIALVLIAIVVIMPVLMFKTTMFHFRPNMTMEEFHDRFDDESVVKQFKQMYPKSGAGIGNNAAMLMPAWGYISNNGTILAELRVQDNFGKYEFTYFCGDIPDTYVSVNIQNPTVDDINNNLCW